MPDPSRILGMHPASLEHSQELRQSKQRHERADDLQHRAELSQPHLVSLGIPAHTNNVKRGEKSVNAARESDQATRIEMHDSTSSSKSKRSYAEAFFSAPFNSPAVRSKPTGSIQPGRPSFVTPITRPTRTTMRMTARMPEKPMGPPLL